MRPRQIADMFGLDAVGRACERIVWGGIGRTMLSGFNTNFRYRGVLFHVQTEDSGQGNPHIITHLFHGGNILASRKSEYADLLAGDQAELEDSVRQRMESQHKTMLKSLSRGEHDTVIGERLGVDALDPPTASRAEVHSTTDAAASAGSSAPAPAPAPASPRTGPSPSSPSGAPSTVPSGSRSAEPAAAASAAESSAAPGGASPRAVSGFGDRVVSEKPLDEVVLDYLVENARKRKRKPQ